MKKIVTSTDELIGLTLDKVVEGWEYTCFHFGDKCLVVGFGEYDYHSLAYTSGEDLYSHEMKQLEIIDDDEFKRAMEEG